MWIPLWFNERSTGLKMKGFIFTFLVLVFVGAYSGNAKDDKNAITQIQVLEGRLLGIKNESAYIPVEELEKASRWIEDAKGTLDEGEPTNPNADLLLKKASYQIEFLEALLEESKAKKKVDDMRELLQRIKTQIEEIQTTNARVKEEISKLEQK